MRFWSGMAALATVSLLSSAAAQESGDPTAGREFAKAVCAECHAVEAGELFSPNPLSPTFDQIAAVPGMTATALYVVLSNPHREMPDFILKPDELHDVTAYILTLKPD